MLLTVTSNAISGSVTQDEINESIEEAIKSVSLPESVRYTVNSWGFLKYGLEGFNDVTDNPSNYKYKKGWGQNVVLARDFVDRDRRLKVADVLISGRGPRAGIYNTIVKVHSAEGIGYISNYIDKNSTSFTEVCRGKDNYLTGGELGFKITLNDYRAVFARYDYSSGSGGMWEKLVISKDFKLYEICPDIELRSDIECIAAYSGLSISLKNRSKHDMLEMLNAASKARAKKVSSRLGKVEGSNQVKHFIKTRKKKYTDKEYTLLLKNCLLSDGLIDR